MPCFANGRADPPSVQALTSAPNALFAAPPAVKLFSRGASHVSDVSAAVILLVRGGGCVSTPPWRLAWRGRRRRRRVPYIMLHSRLALPSRQFPSCCCCCRSVTVLMAPSRCSALLVLACLCAARRGASADGGGIPPGRRGLLRGRRVANGRGALHLQAPGPPSACHVIPTCRHSLPLPFHQ